MQERDGYRPSKSAQPFDLIRMSSLDGWGTRLSIDATESCQELSQTPVGSGQGQFTQQGSGAKIESGVAVATSFLCQG
jgi:hypothetical protein